MRESEQRFKAIADHTPDHILMQDRDLRYTLVVNPQLGLTEKDMLGKTDIEILGREDAAKLICIKRQVIETGVPMPVETSIASKTGEQGFFEGTYVP